MSYDILQGVMGMVRRSSSVSLRLIAIGILLSLALLGSAVWAAGGACAKCPRCENRICVPERVTVKEKKHCWEVECKEICIPGFKGPWQSCCEPPACGRVRTVKELKKVEYECERCGYRWEPACATCK